LQPSRRYEVYLPLEYNDGTPIEPGKFLALQQEFLQRFSGLTQVAKEFPLRGIWRQEERTYFDNIVIYTLYDFASDFSPNQQFFESYKETLKDIFQQEEILIVVQDLFVI
jgi:hypothetical protein